LATATEAAADARSVRTAAELLAEAAQLAATERTATWLDQLTHTGVLTRDQRAQLAAEDGAANLTRILRRAELAGHDPYQILVDAVADRPLEGARNLSNVIYSRIRNEHRFDPLGERWAEWVPRLDNAEWNDYLRVLARAADRRTADLGARAAAEVPGWAIAAFGPPPNDSHSREEWERQAGLVAAYREFRGHDDPVEALGSAPKPGQVEAYAAYRAAWRALGRPEVEREEFELSDGQLRLRKRAWEREKAWGPRYVGNELAGTSQAAATHRQTAALRTAEAAAAVDSVQRPRLRTEAAQATALARVLEQQAAKLQIIDDARARWLAHTAMTRVKAERSQAELDARHLDDTEPEQHITAAEWLAAHRAAVADDERHRDVTDADVTDRPDDLHMAVEHTHARASADAARGRLDEDRHAGRPAAEHGDKRDARRDRDLLHAQDPSQELRSVSSDRYKPARELASPTHDVPQPDLREIAAREPAPVREDVVRVPNAEETSDALAAAHRALAEIRARETLDAHEQAEHRAVQLTRWNTDDRGADEQLQRVNDDAAELAVAYDRGGP
jgi:hypothetical protein